MTLTRTIPTACCAALALAVLLPTCADAFVLSDFNGTGFDYTWEGFSQTTGPDSVRLRDPQNGWGGATIEYSNPLDLTALTGHYLETDFFTNTIHGSDSFTLEFYDTGDRSVKYAVPTAFGASAPQTHTVPHTFGEPQDGIGDYANFDYANVRSFTVIGQWQGTQPFDIGLDEVRFSPDPPPPYGGHAADAPWRAEAEARIDQVRKAELSLDLSRPGGAPLAGAVVRVRQQEHAFKFGTAVTARNLTRNRPDDLIYRQKVEELFNIAVMENALKWQPWEGEFGDDYSRQRALDAVDWLNANDIAVRGHNMVWPSWDLVPNSVAALQNDPAALRQAVLDHIEEIGEATRGKLYDWDVVNEPRFNRDLMDVLGDEVIDEWFAQARQHSDARLFLNEYNIIVGNDRYAAERQTYLYEILGLQQRGAPIDAIGMQGHFRRDTLTDIDKVWAILDDFATATGLPIAITEYDFDTTDEQLQAEHLRDFMTAVFAHEAVDEFLMWGFWEDVHWRPNAALFRSDWSIKPNGQAYLDLVYDQWWTDETLTTDADGRAALRVFQGEHLVEVEIDGVTETFLLTVGPDGEVLSAELASAATAGDYNRNGLVEQGDLNLVLQNWGRDADVLGAPAGWLADLPSGLIDQTELNRVLQNWGDTAAPPAIALPEPAGALLIGLTALAANSRRRRGAARPA